MAPICAFGRCDREVADDVILAHVLEPKRTCAAAGAGC